LGFNHLLTLFWHIVNMTKTISYYRRNQQTIGAARIAYFSTAILGLVAYAPVAHATGTLAGTDITNTATASYDSVSGPVTLDSNVVVVQVDELLDVTVTNTDPGDVTTTPGAASNVQTFNITNTGNGSEAFTLTPNVTLAGDDFNPALVQVVLDTNNNGVYDPGVDTVYVAGTNNPVLAPDTSVRVFVVTSTPSTPTNGNRAEVGLTAVAVTGSGAPGTSFPGAGTAGSDAVVGTTGADAEDTGFLAVQSATLSLTKSATVVDPFGGTTVVPGSVITYTLTANVTGAGSLNNVSIIDPIPSGTTYEAGTITYQSATQTDGADGDAGNFNGTRVAVTAGNVPAGSSRVVTFKVKVQ
jgi:uncharacterized repeat protein (TIGR01451 family)